MTEIHIVDITEALTEALTEAGIDHRAVTIDDTDTEAVVVTASNGDMVFLNPCYTGALGRRMIRPDGVDLFYPADSENGTCIWHANLSLAVEDVREFVS